MLHKPPKGPLAFDDPIWRGLVACWLMNENSGDKIWDSTGEAGIGTLHGNPQWIAGKFGCALNFDGTGDYVTAALPTNLDPANPISVSFWAKQSGTSLQGMINIQKAAGDSGQILVIYGDPPNNRLSTSHATAVATSQYSTSVNLSNYNHYLVTHAGGAVKPDIYVNGTLKNSGSGQGLSDWGSNLISIGAGLNYNDTYNFEGDIDNVLVFCRVLSANEAKQLFKNPFRGMQRRTNPSVLYVAGAPPAGHPYYYREFANRRIA